MSAWPDARAFYKGHSPCAWRVFCWPMSAVLRHCWGMRRVPYRISVTSQPMKRTSFRFSHIKKRGSLPEDALAVLSNACTAVRFVRLEILVLLERKINTKLW